MDYQQLVMETTKSVLELVEGQLDEGLKLKMVYKEGADGAGGHTVWQSTEMRDAEHHLFQHGIVPLRLEAYQNDGADDVPLVLWRNLVPNSSLSLRVIFLIREKETDPDLIDLVVGQTDISRSKLHSEGVNVEIGSKSFQVEVQIIDSMKDIKFRKNISGLSGADCLLCQTKQEEWLDRERIEEGFTIDRTAQDTAELYLALADDNGNIQRRPGDFETRKGLTQKPLTISDQRSITITHQWINGTRWFIKFLTRVHVHVLKWRVGKVTGQGQRIEAGKERVLKVIEEKCNGLRLERVQGGEAHTGTSTTGNAGRRWFSAKSIDAIKFLVDDSQQEAVLDLHVKLSALLRVLSCAEHIKVDVFDRLVKETMLLLAEKFPWARLNFTLHQIQHAGQLICENGGRGLGEPSEEALEANNKDMRNFMQDTIGRSLE